MNHITDKCLACVIILLLIFSCGRIDHKVFYINSYHAGYAPSDSVEEGISDFLKNKDVKLQKFYLNSKKQSSPDSINARVEVCLKKIKKFNPDLIIASDDNAVKYVIEPWFGSSKVPVVYCGVNWSAENYNLPHEHITGMLEVLPLHEVLRKMKHYYHNADTLAILSENSTSENNNRLILETLYRNEGFVPLYYLVNDYGEWKNSYSLAQDKADILYLPANGAINNWDNDSASVFVNKHIVKPSFTCDDFMMEFVVFGMTKIPREQGEWAAHTALKILNGTRPEDIAITKNRKHEIWLNQKLAEKIAFPAKTSEFEEIRVINQ